GTEPTRTIDVAVTPATQTVRIGQTFQFTATVTITPEDPSTSQNVTWSVEEAGQGTISASGLYTPPASETASPMATVRATSVADNRESATAVITIPTAADIVALGWSAFEAGEFSKAASEFEDALLAVSGLEEALVGRGWAAYRQNQSAAAAADFDGALAQNPASNDARAGAVLVAASENRPGDLVPLGLVLLASNPDYTFSHDVSVSASDIRWLVAQAALDIGDFPEVVRQLDSLSPGHGLDPESADFVQRALEILESLRDSV
ncbi:MAG: hypothetical protein HKN21_15945, partial [Candidatus Eisenbacteria bacterium]|nr:hypothetical protein [Candidatus Eisenbacteria bacterium]